MILSGSIFAKTRLLPTILSKSPYGYLWGFSSNQFISANHDVCKCMISESLSYSSVTFSYTQNSNASSIQYRKYDRILTLSTALFEKLDAKVHSAGIKCCRVPLQTSLKDGSAVIFTVPCANSAKVSAVTTRLGHPSGVHALPTYHINDIKSCQVSIKAADIQKSKSQAPDKIRDIFTDIFHAHSAHLPHTLLQLSVLIQF